MTEGPRVKALFEIYTWILCLSYLHEKQTSIIQSLYSYFVKIVPVWLWNIRFLNTQQGGIENSRRARGSYVMLAALWKMDVKLFLMFIVAQNTRSVNIFIYIYIAFADT